MRPVDFLEPPYFVDSIDDRLQSFVAWRGEVPPAARRLEDFEARPHGATWVQRYVGKGIAGAYVIGFQHGEAWWTYFFDHISDDDTPQGAERWRIESYDSQCHSWKEHFFFWPLQGRWTRTSAAGVLVHWAPGLRSGPDAFG